MALRGLNIILLTGLTTAFRVENTQSPGFISHALRVWDLTIGQDGAFGIGIYLLEAQKPNEVKEQDIMEGSF